MAETSGFFRSVNGDRKYSVNFLAKWAGCFVSNGVYNGELAVTAGENMQIIIPAGRAWVGSNGERYKYENDSNMVIAIANADGVLARKDTVVLRWDLNERNITAQVLTGTFSSNPVAPPIVRTAEQCDLKLAELCIAPGTTAITQAAITDTRMDNAVCGIVTSIIDQVDTTTFYNQIQADLAQFKGENEAEFTAWFQSLQDILDENTAGNLLNLITIHTGNAEIHVSVDDKTKWNDGIVSTYTHTKNGTTHNLDGTGNNITFLATADIADGDTWTVNGQPVTVALQNGDPLPDELFKAENWVTGVRLDGAKLGFKSAGGTAKYNVFCQPTLPTDEFDGLCIITPTKTSFKKLLRKDGFKIEGNWLGESQSVIPNAPYGGSFNMSASTVEDLVHLVVLSSSNTTTSSFYDFRTNQWSSESNYATNASYTSQKVPVLDFNYNGCIYTVCFTPSSSTSAGMYDVLTIYRYVIATGVRTEFTSSLASASGSSCTFGYDDVNHRLYFVCSKTYNTPYTLGTFMFNAETGTFSTVRAQGDATPTHYSYGSNWTYDKYNARFLTISWSSTVGYIWKLDVLTGIVSLLKSFARTETYSSKPDLVLVYDAETIVLYPSNPSSFTNDNLVCYIFKNSTASVTQGTASPITSIDYNNGVSVWIQNKMYISLATHIGYMFYDLALNTWTLTPNKNYPRDGNRIRAVYNEKYDAIIFLSYYNTTDGITLSDEIIDDGTVAIRQSDYSNLTKLLVDKMGFYLKLGLVQAWLVDGGIFNKYDVYVGNGTKWNKI